jgi:SEC-C motif-containing protein
MKSRYSAYAYNEANYIIKTTHGDNIEYTNDIKKWKADIEAFCKYTDFIGLNILSFEDGENEAFVKFKAHLKIDGEDESFTEESRFLKENNHWLYHSAKIS